MLTQWIYFGIMAVVTVIIFATQRESTKVLLSAAIFVAPWQGGVWISFMDMDLRMTSIWVLIVMFLIIFDLFKSGKTPLFCPQIAISTLVVMIITFIASLNAVDGNAANRGVFIFLLNYLMFFCIINLIRRPEDFKYIITPLALSLIFEGILGMFQFKFMRFKIGTIDASSSFMYWRATGTLFHSNSYGMYLILSIPVVFRYLLLSLQRKLILKTVLYSVSIVCALLGLILSRNRGSWAGLILGLVIIFMFDFFSKKSRMKKIILRYALLGVLLVSLLSIRFAPIVIKRLFHDDTNVQVENRLNLQAEAMELIQNNFWGIGFSNYHYHSSKMFVHNLFLLVWLEMGQLGLIAFVILLFLCLLIILKGIKSNNYIVNNISLGALGAYIAVLFASWVGPDFLVDVSLSVFLFILIGILFVAIRIHNQSLDMLNLYLEKESSEEKKKFAVKSIANRWLQSI